MKVLTPTQSVNLKIDVDVIHKEEEQDSMYIIINV